MLPLCGVARIHHEEVALSRIQLVSIHPALPCIGFEGIALLWASGPPPAAAPAAVTAQCVSDSMKRNTRPLAQVSEPQAHIQGLRPSKPLVLVHCRSMQYTPLHSQPYSPPQPCRHTAAQLTLLPATPSGSPNGVFPSALGRPTY